MRFFGLTAMLALTASIAAASAHTQQVSGHPAAPADVVVTHWSEIAAAPLTALPPARAVPGMAMVHGAIYDAVNAIDGGHQPYLAQPPASPTASVDAAVAAAASRGATKCYARRATSTVSKYSPARRPVRRLTCR
jgi:hypothetical protein